jgi:excisionase family DNA binding protein
MKTIPTDGIPAEQIDVLDQFAGTRAVSPELRDLLQSVIRCLRDGEDLAAISPLTEFTPSQAAERLGMSRTHLYKLLDQGEIMFHRVGRDRRIALRDLIAFEGRRQRDRRELAERFGAQNRTNEGSIDELADLL